MPKAKKGDLVKVHYTGTLTNGEKFDSSIGRDPLQFTVGAGQMIKGFDAAVDGMELNDKVTVNIPAAEAYGPVNDQLVQRIDRANLPADLKPELGQKLVASAPNGHQMRVTVVELTDAEMVVDANHELAGKDLVFEIELVEIGA